MTAPARLGRAGVLVVVAIAWVAITSQRLEIWQDEAALWADAAYEAPPKPRPWVNLGIAYQHRGDVGMAHGAYLLAVAAAQRPTRTRQEQVVGLALAYANLALLNSQWGDWLERSEAQWEIAHAIDLVPTMPELRAIQTWIHASE